MRATYTAPSVELERTIMLSKHVNTDSQSPGKHVDRKMNCDLYTYIEYYCVETSQQWQMAVKASNTE